MICGQKINDAIKQARNAPKERVFEILKKASEKKGLSIGEAAVLLSMRNRELMDEMFRVSAQVKSEMYGKRLVLFAPLYASSHCINDCAYCGFKSGNTARRKRLTMQEVAEQTELLINMGHKRVLLELGEHPQLNSIDYVLNAIRTIYETKNGNGEIRRVNVNIAAAAVADYRLLKEIGIGTYQLFQETYDPETYRKLHKGPKADYERQFYAHHRAFEAGIDDVGLGVLFGLYDYRFEALALIMHAQELEKVFGVGPHTVSVPRWKPANGVKWRRAPYAVSDEELMSIVAVLRLAMPYTGIIMSTRERPQIRARAFDIGVSQTSAASKTSPGGYSRDSGVEQFLLADYRTLEDVFKSIVEQGLLPSFCTACYRRGRTGERFMALAKPGEIHRLCGPNALLTFVEYLLDYAPPSFLERGWKIVDDELCSIAGEKIREQTAAMIERIKSGERDLYF